MNKIEKIIVIIMFSIIIAYIAITLYKQNISINNVDNTSGDEEQYFEDYMSNVKYSLESGENTISIIAAGSGEKSTTNYIFENDKLIGINVIEEVYSGDGLRGTYENFLKNEDLTQIYSSINIEGDKIILKLKDEYVDSFGEKSMSEIYDEINNSMFSK